MLFYTPAFLFFFLPVTYGLFLLLKKQHCGQLALTSLGIASLVFYAWWDPRYLILLLASLTVNHFIGTALTERGPDKRLLVFGLAANLICLGWFKYADFITININAVTHAGLPLPHVILPLGISFFTFVQIAYLVDAYKGAAGKHTYIEYLTFVTFFPHLIAGPILNHKSIIPQFHSLPSRPYDWTMAATGLVLFAIGMFKKVMIADTLAHYATPVFDSAAHGNPLPFPEAWKGVLAYTLQIYFDFSGYSDMALGLGLLFGIRLPENFLSPYKSSSIIEFWRRWHITLSGFLKTYLYIPLGGSRKGPARQYANLLLTMLLGGLWHGAGWTFVIWGGLHGTYLVVNHLWRRIWRATTADNIVYKTAGWLLTLLVVMAAWVFFRSDNTATALHILTAMADMQTLAFPHGKGMVIILAAALLVLVAPNSMQMIAYAENPETPRRWHSFAPTPKWMVFTVLLLLASLYTVVYNLNHISEFIYFRF